MKRFATAFISKLFPKSSNGNTQVSLLGLIFLLLLVPTIFSTGVWISPIFNAFVAIFEAMWKLISTFASDIHFLGTSITSNKSYPSHYTDTLPGGLNSLYKSLYTFLSLLWNNQLAATASTIFLYMVTKFARVNGTPNFVKRIGFVLSVLLKVSIIAVLIIYGEDAIRTLVIVSVCLFNWYVLIKPICSYSSRKRANK